MTTTVPGTLTVTFNASTNAFTVRRRTGPYTYTATSPGVDGVLLTETGDYLALETGDLLLA